MADPRRLRRIYDRTNGRCHICRKKLSLANYAQPNERGAWEIEHSRARALGGSDHLNNLYPACINCNRDKGTLTSRTVRSYFGHQRAPLSKEGRAKARQSRAVAGGLGGLALGGVLGGPPAALLLGIVGALVGHGSNPD